MSDGPGTSLFWPGGGGEPPSRSTRVAAWSGAPESPSNARLPRRKTFELDVERLKREPVTRLETAAGEVKVVPQPEGTSGYDDLRRASTREPLGQGIRAPVASVGDLARMLAALGRAHDAERLGVLRRLAELDRSRALGR